MTQLSAFQPLILDETGPFEPALLNRWDRMAHEIALDPTGPVIESYDTAGNRIDRIRLPESVRELRREVVEAGIFNNGSQTELLQKTFCLSHIGEASVCCPLACTEGLIRVIEAVGSDFLKKTYLPKLRSAETPLAGSQFITEQDCGSDVGALQTRAVPDKEGSFRLYGEKWFCSAIDDFFLIAARPEGAPIGTRGVAIFFVPRMRDGSLNQIRIKRLKNKLGTRELPTAEIDLEGTLAYPIGPLQDSFKNLMNHVINTSRLMNAACALGFMNRALLEAENYCRQRRAFGKVLNEHPMVKQGLASMHARFNGLKNLFFSLGADLDKNPTKEPSLWQRFLINLCKYRTSIAATWMVHEAILLLGGNGTIETFSILPRLYRDSMVLESWEGSHNTLALQICRDGVKFPFREMIEERLRPNPVPAGFEKLTDEDWVAENARRFVDSIGDALEKGSSVSL